MRKSMHALMAFVAVSCLLISFARSQGIQANDVPRVISYQAALTDANGNPLRDDDYRITVRLYADKSGSQCIWHDTYHVHSTRGVIDLSLGGGATPLPDGSAMSGSLWLGIQINDGDEIKNYSELTAAPYALNVPNGAITAQKMGTDYVGSISINGQRVSSKGGDLNIITSDGLTATIDPTTNALLLGTNNQSAQTAKGSAVESNSTITGNLTVVMNTLLNTGLDGSGHTTQTSIGSNSAANPGILNLQQGLSSGGHQISLQTTTGTMSSDAVITLPAITGTATVQGNTFNGAGQLVQLDAFGKLSSGIADEFIANSPNQQSGSQFNISGQGKIGGALTVGSDLNFSGDLDHVIGPVSGATNSGGALLMVSQSGGAGWNGGVLQFGGGFGGNATSSNQGGVGGNVTALAGNGGNASSTQAGGTGGNISDQAGSGGNAFAGGSIARSGGSASFNAGNGGNAAGSNPGATGGQASISGGLGGHGNGASASSGDGGALFVQGGSAGQNAGGTQGNGGLVIVRGGSGTTTGTVVLQDQAGSVDLGNSSGSLTIRSTNFSVSSFGNVTGVNGLSNGGNLNQAGTAVFSNSIQTPLAAGVVHSGGSGTNLTSSAVHLNSDVDNVLSVLNGGTGAASSTAALNNLLPSQTSFGGQFLTTDGLGTVSWASVGAGSGWGLTGNASTSAGTNFIGTSDNQALEIHIFNNDAANSGSKRVVRYEPNATSANIIGGYQSNSAGSGHVGATIGGGGSSALGSNGTSGNFATVAGGSHNVSGDDFATVSGGSNNFATSAYSTISGGSQNDISGLYSAIPGGNHLTLNGSGSFGFLGNMGSTNAMSVNSDQVAVFGNVDVWIANNDNVNHQLRFYSSNSTSSGPFPPAGLHFAALKAAPSMSADAIFTLPASVGSANQVLSTDGSGVLSWSNSSGLTNFVEALSTTAPNATVPTVSLSATNAETDVDAAFIPKGAGALLTETPDNTAAGGNKRGAYATDLQRSRTSNSQVASAPYGTVSGGLNNTASRNSTFDFGASTVGGGANNHANGNYSTIAGGHNNIADMANSGQSSVGGGENNHAEGDYNAIAGGWNNTTIGLYSAILGGKNNVVDGDGSAIIGGTGLTFGFAAQTDFGFLGDNLGENHNASISAANTAFLGNVDLWLGDNDGTARQLRFYGPNSTNGNFPPAGLHYTSFVAGSGMTADLTYTLPIVAPTAGQMLSSDASGVLSWATAGASGWGLTGNSGTSAGTNFIGTTDDQPFEIHVNEGGAIHTGTHRVMRYEPNATSPNIIGGFQANNISGGVIGATIAGGGEATDWNSVTGSYGTVSGGSGNTAGAFGTVAGGEVNNADGGQSSVGGGQFNGAEGQWSTIGGGGSNSTLHNFATVGGGNSNAANGFNATVSGGAGNTAGGDNSTVSGGNSNSANGSFSAVIGGSGLDMEGNRSVGFLANAASQNMRVHADNTAILGNVDLWLADNDGTSHEIRFYTAHGNTSLDYPAADGYYVGFKAPASLSASTTFALPAGDGTAGQALVTDGSAHLSWSSTMATSTNFTGSLAGDVTGTQSSTVVASVGGSTSASVHSAELLANAATSANTASTIVKRRADGGFLAGPIQSSSLEVGNNTTSTAGFLIVDDGASHTGTIQFNGPATMSHTYWLPANDGTLALTSDINSSLSGSTGQVTYFSGAHTAIGDANFTWDHAMKHLGIGTGSPQYELDIVNDHDGVTSASVSNPNSGANAVADFKTFSDVETVGFGFGSASSTFTAPITGDNFVLSQSRPIHVITLASMPIKFSTGGIERMRLDESGKLGIGTTTPLSQVDVNVDQDDVTSVSVSNASSGSNAVADFKTFSDVETSGFVFGSASSSFNAPITGDDFVIAETTPMHILTLSSKPIKFSTAGIERMRLDESGSLGVGTMTPLFAVDVLGTVNASAGFTVAGAAASGEYLRGDGGTFVSSPIQTADIPGGSGNYIQNGTSQQTGASFNINGSATIGAGLSVSGFTSINGGTEFAATNIGNAINGNIVNIESHNPDVGIRINNNGTGSTVIGNQNGAVSIDGVNGIAGDGVMINASNPSHGHTHIGNQFNSGSSTTIEVDPNAGALTLNGLNSIAPGGFYVNDGADGVVGTASVADVTALLASNGNFINNSRTQQVGADFNIDGTGTIGGTNGGTLNIGATGANDGATPAGHWSTLTIDGGERGGNGPVIRMVGGGFNGVGNQVHIDIATTGVLNANASIVATDDGVYGANLDFQTLVPGSSANSLVSRLYIQDAGNVGIGTTSPGAKLDVNGSVNASGAATFASDVSVAGHVIATSNATATSADAGVTISDVPVFIISNSGSTTGAFVLTLPSSPQTGDVIIVINKDDTYEADYPNSSTPTAVVPSLGSRTFYFDGTSWQ